ncbi:metalloprotease [Ganoderma leucocontextum]|nr:metalloprotease [Ganoderma leucocontextum]
MLRGPFLSIAAFIAAAVATPSLVLEVSGPSTIYSVDSFNITTTVRNAGDQAVMLLNHPRGPLSDLPTDMFTITNRHGLSPDFVGIGQLLHSRTTMRTPSLRLGTPSQHEISDAYDFSTSGPGQYVIRMKGTRRLYYVADGQVSILVGGRSDPFHTVTVVGDARSHKSRPHRRSSEQCEAWRDRAIYAAIPLAEKYVHHAVEALKKGGRKGAEYKRWFGPALNGNRHSSVSGRFEALADNDFAEYTYSCDSHFCANRPGLFGYVYPNKFGTIHLCKQVFEAEVGGHDSRASTIIHQALRSSPLSAPDPHTALLFAENGGGVEHTHGEALALELAESFPHLAAANAENYEYFAVAATGSWSGEGEDDVSVLLTEVHFSKHMWDL